MSDSGPFASGKRRRLSAWCALLLPLPFLLFPANQGSQAPGQPPLESQVKAAFLLNFTKFTEWPADNFPDAESPIAICVSGAAAVAQVLEQMVEGESVNGRKVVLRKVPPDPSKSCNVLFVGKSENEVPKLVASLGRKILTVGEKEGFLADGGMIGFVIDNRRVRFDINRKALANSDVKLSSKLFNVARRVE